MGELFCLHKDFVFSEYKPYYPIGSEMRSKTTWDFSKCPVVNKYLITIIRRYSSNTDNIMRHYTTKDIIEPVNISLIQLFQYDKTAKTPSGIEFRIFQRDTKYNNFFLEANEEWEYLKIITEFKDVSKKMKAHFYHHYIHHSV